MNVSDLAKELQKITKVNPHYQIYYCDGEFGDLPVTEILIDEINKRVVVS